MSRNCQIIFRAIGTNNTGNIATTVEKLLDYERLQKAGVKNLYYIPGEHLFGDDGEGSTDGSHPNDLGFMRQAEIFAQVLVPLLPTEK